MRVEPILYALVCIMVVIASIMIGLSGKYNGLSKIKFSNFQKIIVTYYFSSECIYCAMEDEMFDNLTDKYSDRFIIEKFDVVGNQTYWKDIKSYADKFNVTPVVPFVIIREHAFAGFTKNNSENIEKIISGK